MTVIKINNLSKSYGDIKAVKDISLQVKKDEIFGLIGPDGAGKTTIFRIIATLLLPDKGTVEVLGLDAAADFKKLRKKLGYMPGKFSLYQDLSVEENLKFFASIFDTTIEENYHLIEDIYHQIEPFRKRKAGKLSGGMKQKLALSCALIHKPELLVLDEPTTGVDAVSRKEFWEMLAKLRSQGISIIVSTPYMDEASLCGRVALIQDGRLLGVAAPKEIISDFPKKLYGISTSKKYELLQIIRKYENTHSVFPFGDMFHYTDKNDEADLEEMEKYFKNNGISDFLIKEIEPGIEDAFMRKMLTKDKNG